ncbi:MAG TPA: recombinase family protein [Symbiobacteriaceae bacterium]|jgi:site-specific DNA recombinase
MTCWAFYGRVSGLEQAANQSLPTQQEACHCRARERGATEILDFMDAGVPGDLDWTDRPALNRLLELVEQGGLAGVVIYDPDRLARDLGVQLAVTEIIARHQVQLEFCTQQYDASPEGLLFYQLRGAIAQFERAKIRERTNRGRKKLLKSGIPANKPPIYGLSYDRASNTFTPVESEAVVVGQIFRWAGEGHGPVWIARRLNSLGTPPPRGTRSSGWWAHVVRRMLASPTYAGRLYLHRWNLEGTRKNRYLPPERKHRATQRPREEWVEVQVPPIVTTELWQQVQARHSGNRRRHAGAESPTYAYLASRLLRCGLCGNAMTGASARRKCGRTFYYRCSGRYGERQVACLMPHLRAAELDDALWRAVSALLLEPGRYKAALLAGAEGPPPGPVLPEVGAERVAELRGDIGRLEGLIARGTVREHEVRAALKSLRDQEAALADHLRASAGQPLQPLPPAPDAVARFDGAERREFVRAVLHEVVAFPDGVLQLVPREPSDGPPRRQ